MFGFQRVGDFAWAAGDMRSRGFLLGGTAGRTTLNGEGLQHEDGHSHLMSATIPNCISYDPTFAYEVVTILRDGLRRMVTEQQDVYYYLTVMNENYPHPAMPEGSEEAIVKGMYKFREGAKSTKKNTSAAGPSQALVAPPLGAAQRRKPQAWGSNRRAFIAGSGTIFREVIAAADLLKNDWGVDADLWSSRASLSSRAKAMRRSAGIC